MDSFKFNLLPLSASKTAFACVNAAVVVFVVRG